MNTLLTGEDVFKKEWFHFSIDDVFDALIEVTEENISLFDHPFFSLLKEMHDRYGINIGLHLFYQKEINGKLKTLSDIRDLKKELCDAGGWIYFGPHALDYETAPFNQTPEDQMNVFDNTYFEIDRFAGKNFYTRFVRLHFYSESYELANYFKKRGVVALFSTDRSVGSHRMPENVKDILNTQGLANYGGIHFIRTQFRVEFFADDNYNSSTIENLFKDSIKKYGYIVLYTHEYEFKKENVRETLRKSFEILSKLSILSLNKV